MAKNKIIVTGASGFVGRQTLAPLVEQNFEVHAVARNPISDIKQVTWHKIDLFKQEERIEMFKKIAPQYLLHCAWYAEHGKFWNAMENLQWIAVSTDILRAFKTFGGKRVVAVGTCAEYDWKEEDNSPWKEDKTCDPHTLYGEAKLNFYKILKEFSIANDLSFCWARLFLMFGPHEPAAKLIPSVINSLLDNKPAKCSSGIQVRDFLDVRDVGKILSLLVKNPITDAVNIGSGREVTIKEIVTLLGDIAGKKNLVRIGALPDRESEPRYMVGDNSKLIQAIDSSIPDIKERLEENFLWWKKQR